MVEFEVVDVNDLNLAGRVENLLAILLFGLPVLDGCLDCSLKLESELYDSYELLHAIYSSCTLSN